MFATSENLEEHQHNLHENIQEISVNLHQNCSESSTKTKLVERKENKEKTISSSSSLLPEATSSLSSIATSSQNS